jgi:phage terminase small subunit
MDKQLETVHDVDGHMDLGMEHTAPLLAKREAFAAAFVELQSATLAYRRVYDCSGMLPATARRKAYDLRHAPDVAARVRELYAEAAADTIVDTRSRMVRLQSIVEADPSELVSIVREACRRCHSAGHHYHWIDSDEFSIALARAIDAREALPDDLGGYGFTPHVDPHPSCPECHGHGVTRVVVTPTDQLSPGARALLHSIKQKPSGEIEVRLVDRLAASDQLNRMAGVYVDKSVSVTAHVNVPSLAEIASDPAKAADFLESIRPTRPAPIDVEAVDVTPEPAA